MPNGHRTATLGLTFFWGIALFCTFALLAWILFRFEAPQETVDDKRVKSRIEKRDALMKENEAKLEHYAWKDKNAGTVQLPITRAMELVVADLSQNKKPVAPSQVKVDNPYPYGLQSPAGANPAVAPGPAPGTNPSTSPAPAAAAPAAPNTNAPELKKP